MDQPFVPSKEVLDLAFSDAGVIDVDFSNWDQRVSLVIVADHLWDEVRSSLPICVVDFHRTRSVSVKFNHYESKFYDSGDRYAWNVDRWRVVNIRDGLLDIELIDGSSQPRLEITCESIELREISRDTMDRALGPHWSRPGGPLARLGVEALAARGGLPQND